MTKEYTLIDKRSSAASHEIMGADESARKGHCDFADKNVLLIIAGGISAYKSLELIRLLKKFGIKTPAILTAGGQQFITPLSVSALSGEAVYTDLFSLKDESEMGHIQLSRQADLIVVVPASANIIARAANGMADDLACAVLLAANKDILICPAMNPQMWENKATQHNIETLQSRDIDILMPDSGEMACGEIGAGRLPDPEHICAEILSRLSGQAKPLTGYTALVTAGPTYEKIDPVRFIGNRSSGKQGYAIAQALYKQGAEVHLISGPTALTPPKGVHIYNVESADEMLDVSLKALPADIAICTAAVSDWRVENAADQKLKKCDDGLAPILEFAQTPDILKTLAEHKTLRPTLLIGFAAETNNVDKNGRDKFKRKGCDALLVNEISAKNAVFGADHNRVDYLTQSPENKEINTDAWPYMSKAELANMLVSKIIQQLEKTKTIPHTQCSTPKLKATK